tara:strand:- start:980 stop:1168 length:189 start_codon:yes stop_codon:yes gene_type:complete
MNEDSMPYKKYTQKQKRLAAVSSPRKKITKSDVKGKRKLPKRGERTKTSMKKRGGSSGYKKR